MTGDPPQLETKPDAEERPWQFSLLHLFGLTTVICIGAAAFYWNPEIGMLVSSGLFLCIAAFYRTKAVVHVAPLSFRNRKLASLIAFGIFTSAVATFAPFVLTFLAVMSFASGAPWSAEGFFLRLGCVLGCTASAYVLYRSWPRKPAPKGE